MKSIRPIMSPVLSGFLQGAGFEHEITPEFFEGMRKGDLLIRSDLSVVRGNDKPVPMFDEDQSGLKLLGQSPQFCAMYVTILAGLREVIQPSPIELVISKQDKSVLEGHIGRGEFVMHRFSYSDEDGVSCARSSGVCNISMNVEVKSKKTKKTKEEFRVHSFVKNGIFDNSLTASKKPTSESILTFAVEYAYYENLRKHVFSGKY